VEIDMADYAELDPPQRRLFMLVEKEYKTEGEIAEKHFAFNPLSLEAFIRLTEAMRKRIFKEKKNPSFDELMDTLVDLGLVEQHTAKVGPKSPHLRLAKETTFYRLSEKGKELRGMAKKRR
jgi:hypothetical protein